MKKLIAATLFLGATLLSSSSFAIDACGFICKNKMDPYTIQCNDSFNTCTQNATNSYQNFQCKQTQENCTTEVKNFQNACVQSCLGGEGF